MVIMFRRKITAFVFFFFFMFFLKLMPEIKKKSSNLPKTSRISQIEVDKLPASNICMWLQPINRFSCFHRNSIWLFCFEETLLLLCFFFSLFFFSSVNAWNFEKNLFSTFERTFFVSDRCYKKINKINTKHEKKLFKCISLLLYESDRNLRGVGLNRVWSFFM